MIGVKIALFSSILFSIIQTCVHFSLVFFPSLSTSFFALCSAGERRKGQTRRKGKRESTEAKHLCHFPQLGMTTFQNTKGRAKQACVFCLIVSAFFFVSFVFLVSPYCSLSAPPPPSPSSSTVTLCTSGRGEGKKKEKLQDWTKDK